MYVIRLKYKDNAEPHYANKNIILPIYDIRNGNTWDLKNFIMLYEEAKALYKHMLINRTDIKMEYLSLVKLNHYPPNNESEVIYYKEFS